MNNLILKFCGLKSDNDVQKAASTSATHLGFIFAEESRRFVEPRLASRWIERVQPQQKTVAVVTSHELNKVLYILKTSQADIVQLHDGQPEAMIKEIKQRLPGIEIWKVIHQPAGHSVNQMSSIHRTSADAYLFDTATHGAKGGTGQTFTWSRLPKLLKEAHKLGVPGIAAGGIRPDNIADLLDYRPDGIDVSSGIETEGNKDANKMIQIEEKVRAHVNDIT